MNKNKNFITKNPGKNIDQNIDERKNLRIGRITESNLVKTEKRS